MSDDRGALSVGVVGAGSLGRTVVLAALQAGSPVTVFVRGTDGRRRAVAAGVHAAIERDAERGRIDAATAAARRGALRVTGTLADLRTADVVIESVVEDVDVKRSVVAALEDVIASDTLIASTTSTIPAGRIAAGARHPERVVVAHYVWPAQRMPLVEVATHAGTSTAAIATLQRLLSSQGKRAVHVGDRPGFLITRALFAYWDAALELVREGVAPGAVDAALERFGWPMGPLRVMEGTTLTSAVAVHRSVAADLDEPLPGLVALGEVVSAAVAGGADGAALRFDEPFVAALRAGRPHRSDDLPDGDIVARTVGAMAAEVERAVVDGVVASWDDAGAAINLAYGFPAAHTGLAQWWQTHRAAAVQHLISA